MTIGAKNEDNNISLRWEVRKIGHVAKLQGGYAFKSKDYTESPGVPLVKITNVQPKALKWEDTSFLPVEFLEHNKDFCLKNGDVVMAMTRPIISSGIKVAKLGSRDVPSLLNQRVGRFVPSKAINNDYLYQFCLSNSFVAEVKKLVLATNQPNISSNQIESISITVPPLSEQNQIVEILSNVDDVISKTDEIIELTKKVKKSLMQELLTKGIGHTEFKETELGEIPIEWGIQPLGEISKARTEKFNPLVGDNRDYLALEHIEQGTGRINGLGKSSETTSIKTIFKKGDVLFGKLRPYLRKYWLAEFDGVCATEIIPLVPKQQVLSHFLICLVQQDRFIEKAVQNSFGTKMPRTSWNEISQTKCLVPPLSEQGQISSIISTIDEKIVFLKGRKSQLEQIKKGLMQDLLTGKVRVKV